MRAVVDDTALPEHARTVEDGPAADLAARAKVDRAEELGGLVDLDVLALDEDATADIRANGVELDPAVEQVGVRAEILGQVADVAPVTGCDEAEDGGAVRQQLWEDLL